MTIEIKDKKALALHRPLEFVTGSPTRQKPQNFGAKGAAEIRLRARSK